MKQLIKAILKAQEKFKESVKSGTTYSIYSEPEFIAEELMRKGYINKAKIKYPKYMKHENCDRTNFDAGFNDAVNIIKGMNK